MRWQHTWERGRGVLCLFKSEALIKRKGFYGGKTQCKTANCWRAAYVCVGVFVPLCGYTNRDADSFTITDAFPCAYLTANAYPLYRADSPCNRLVRDKLFAV